MDFVESFEVDLGEVEIFVSNVKMGFTILECCLVAMESVDFGMGLEGYNFVPGIHSGEDWY